MDLESQRLLLPPVPISPPSSKAQMGCGGKARVGGNQGTGRVLSMARTGKGLMEEISGGRWVVGKSWKGEHRTGQGL